MRKLTLVAMMMMGCSQGESLLSCPDDLEPNGSQAEARRLTPGTAVSGLKACNGDEDWYVVSLGTGEVLAMLARQAGFSDVASDRLTVTLEYDGADDAVGAAFAGGPVALAYSRFDERTRAEAHAEYLASIAPFRTTRGYAIPGEFVVVQAA